MTQKQPERHLLIVDDSPDTRELLQRNLRSRGYEAITANDVSSAIKIIETTHFDLVITDLKMPGASGLDLVRHVRENLIDTEVMMITGYPSVEGAVTAVKFGAEEYLAKPFTKEELFGAVERALEKLDLRRAGRTSSSTRPAAPLGIIGESDVMQKVLKSISKAAAARLPALISGENGTGKHLLAKAVHFLSPRHQSHFISVNCSGLRADELNNLLFGEHVTDMRPAGWRHLGLLELLGNGTLYLDDIADLPEAVQKKLFAVLHDKKLSSGAGGQTELNCMLVAGTNRNLRRLLENGVFREDLFEKLNLNTISIPPLRERGNDIILLARHFLSIHSRNLGRPAPELSEQTLAALKAYPWPGNITELENCMVRILGSTDNRSIDIPHLPAHMRYSAADEVQRNRSLADVEADHIKKVIASVDGNKTRAAEILGINRKTLREKLKQNNIITPPE